MASPPLYQSPLTSPGALLAPADQRPAETINQGDISGAVSFSNINADTVMPSSELGRCMTIMMHLLLKA